MGQGSSRPDDDAGDDRGEREPDPGERGDQQRRIIEFADDEDDDRRPDDAPDAETLLEQVGAGDDDEGGDRDDGSDTTSDADAAGDSAGASATTRAATADVPADDPVAVAGALDVDIDDVHRPAKRRMMVDAIDPNDRTTTLDYPELDTAQYETVRSELVDRHSEKAVESVLHVAGMRRTYDDQEAIQTYERLTKAVAGAGGEVRDGGDRARALTDAERAVYRDLHALSNALVDRHFPDESFTTYRGMGGSQTATLAAAVFDDPDADTYSFSTAPVSYVTTDRRTAEEFSKGVVIERETDPDDVALAIDYVVEPDFPLQVNVGELHLKGGEFTVDAGNVVHRPEMSGSLDRPLTETAQRMDDPETMDRREHTAVAGLIRQMGIKGVTLGTQAGADRVRNWYDTVVETDAMREQSRSSLEQYVEYVTLVGGDGG